MLHDENHSSCVALDVCIDALIAGDEWERYLPTRGDERGDVQQLMVVAERLVAASKVLPRPGPGRKRRIWRQVSSQFSFARLGNRFWLPLPPSPRVRLGIC